MTTAARPNVLLVVADGHAGPRGRLLARQPGDEVGWRTAAHAEEPAHAEDLHRTRALLDSLAWEVGDDVPADSTT